MKLHIPSVSLNESVDVIASQIEEAKHGLIHVHDIGEEDMNPPFDTMQGLFDELCANDVLGDRLNQAYTNNLVYKDSYAKGKGGPTVDRKRVLDLSPERLEAIAKIDPELLQLDSRLDEALLFWGKLRRLSSNLTQALAQAIGTDDVLKDVAFNYRMVDYYAQKKNEEESRAAPRCGEHRDFGWYTLIFAKEPGLQVQVEDGSWVDVVPPVGGDGAILMFGWCTQIRSNGRIPAALHRVVENDDEEKRRTTAIFFVAPKDCETPLDPVVRAGTAQQYISGVKVGQLRGKMARKWQSREGTLNEKNRVLEEEEIRVTKMETQDDVVQSTIAVV
jgi:hypothetical protein